MASVLPCPFVDAILKHVLQDTKLHYDDTPVVSDGNGKTEPGCLWAYATDERPIGDIVSVALVTTNLLHRKAMAIVGLVFWSTARALTGLPTFLFSRKQITAVATF